MTTIAAGTTQNTGYVATVDSSGNLVFQTNGTTTALTLDTAQNANIVGRVTAAGANINGSHFVNGTVTFANSTSNTFNISSAGILGIGTSAANNTTMHVVGDWASGNSTIKLQGKTANLVGVGLYSVTGTRKSYYIYDNDYVGLVSNNIPLIISTSDNASNTVVFADNGSVGIGTNTLDNKLTIGGNTNFSNNFIRNFKIRDYNHRIEVGDTEYGGFAFQTAGGDNNAGYLLLRGVGDSDVYKQGGVTLVTDNGPITLAARGSTVGQSSTNNFIRFMTNSGGGAAERMTISRDGYVTMSAQPRFYACGVTNTTYVSGNYWVFPTTVVNSGSYNTSNGRFTAPVAGTYLFFHSNIAGTTNEVYRYFLYKNGSLFNPSQFRVDTGASGGEYGTNGSKVTMMTLAKDDYVQVYWYSDGATNSYPGTNDTSNEYCIFGGYLLG